MSITYTESAVGPDFQKVISKGQLPPGKTLEEALKSNDSLRSTLNNNMINYGSVKSKKTGWENSLWNNNPVFFGKDWYNDTKFCTDYVEYNHEAGVDFMSNDASAWTEPSAHFSFFDMLGPIGLYAGIKSILYAKRNYDKTKGKVALGAGIASTGVGAVSTGLAISKFSNYYNKYNSSNLMTKLEGIKGMSMTGGSMMAGLGGVLLADGILDLIKWRKTGESKYGMYAAAKIGTGAPVTIGGSMLIIAGASSWITTESLGSGMYAVSTENAATIMSWNAPISSAFTLGSIPYGLSLGIIGGVIAGIAGTIFLAKKIVRKIKNKKKTKNVSPHSSFVE